MCGSGLAVYVRSASANPRRQMEAVNEDDDRWRALSVRTYMYVRNVALHGVRNRASPVQLLTPTI